jgi:hypothetical protein|tara:strand:- start:319 stop:564 length:246 start_codon:yes stop_codon:yes gene_type:complete
LAEVEGENDHQCSGKYLIASSSFNFEFGGRILNGCPLAMSQKIRGPHFSDKLGVQFPTAMIGEGFGFDKNFISVQKQEWSE